MIYRTDLIEPFNLDIFNLLYYIVYFKKINIAEFFIFLSLKNKKYLNRELKGEKDEKNIN